jgi:SWI/SNF-related matrix-associated actin-dependent regulator of chromatin subfamily A3
MAKGIPFLRIDGSLPFGKRKTILDQFQDQSDISVLLMTLGTGAVGYDFSFRMQQFVLTAFRLNSLSVANRIHLLEPQWNPSVESQAIGRVVRLGQQRPVTVVRYIINKTVEKVCMMLR